MKAVLFLTTGCTGPSCDPLAAKTETIQILLRSRSPSFFVVQPVPKRAFRTMQAKLEETGLRPVGHVEVPDSHMLFANDATMSRLMGVGKLRRSIWSSLDARKSTPA